MSGWACGRDLRDGAHSFVSTEALGEAGLGGKPCASRHEMSPCKSHVNEPSGMGLPGTRLLSVCPDGHAAPGASGWQWVGRTVRLGLVVGGSAEIPTVPTLTGDRSQAYPALFCASSLGGREGMRL